MQKHKNYISQHGFSIYYPDADREALKFEKNRLKIEEGQSRKDLLEQE